MPIATLSFTLPEEQEEYDITLKAMDMSIALEVIDSHLRNKIKYDQNISDETRAAHEDIRSVLHTILQSRSLSI